MRTTVTIQDSLLDKAKEAAQRRKCSLGNVIEDALRRTLLSKPGAPAQEPLELKTYKGNGLQPGVNLDSHSDLADLMDEG